MNERDVKRILGDPDEIRPLYEPIIKNPRRIGTTFWYIIQRKTDSGSWAERDEKSVRITFNLNKTVTSVDRL